MKFSLNQIRYYRDEYDWSADPAPDGIDALVQRVGEQLGGVEEVTNVGARYHGVLVAKVISCRKHEDSDHLNVCTIDDGGKAADVERDEDGHVQVVCGAPNVREGLVVAWLPPGVTVPESVGKEPFVLESRTIRGVKSNGMLASPKELGLGDNHDGILELDEANGKPGDDFAKVYGLDDYVIDIENKMFTHRPDCFGMIGVAREIAGIQGMAFKSPDWYRISPAFPGMEGESLPLNVVNELPELVPRFTAVAMSNIRVMPSPLWLQINLLRLGVRPISNIVDYTNYYMLLTGQPLHAYDYDKVKALSNDVPTIVVRNPHHDEKITLISGKTVEPRQEAIMIATDKELIGIGGVMGGADTEVDASTKNIILECATFDMYSIRRTSMTHGLFTDAVTRYSKGQSPLQNIAVLAKITDDIRQSYGGKVASEVFDLNQVAGREWVHPPVPVTVTFINSRLGFELSASEMKTLLENVEFQVRVEGEDLTVTAPFWRTDIETREDVVEEVGRLYGFDKLPQELPLRDIKPATKNAILELKSKVRATLAAYGANEVLTYSFVHGDVLTKAAQNPEDAFQVGNALSPDLQYYRLSLTPSLLTNIHPNIKAGYDQFALFEMGKGHNLLHKDTDAGLPAEFEMLDVVCAASDKLKLSGAAFYEARKYLVSLAAAFNLQLDFRPFQQEEAYPVVKPYDHTRSAQVFVAGTDIALGMIGEYKQSVQRNFKLPKRVAGFGISLEQLLAASEVARHGYVSLPRYPKVTQDITLKVLSDTSYQKVYDFVWGELAKMQPDQTLPSLAPLSIFQRPDDLAHKQITLRFSIASYERTLTDTEIASLLDEIAQAAVAIGAERV